MYRIGMLSLMLGLVLSSSPSVAATAKDHQCMALNIYHEARGEMLQGQIGVGYVVLNRVRDGRWPNNVCAVVRQMKRGVCQFTWNCRPNIRSPRDKVAWHNSQRIASALLNPEQKIKDPTYGSLWYHTTKVNPRWRRGLKARIVIGEHIFYKEKAKK